MITNYFLQKPAYWIIPWILQSVSYYFLLKKMGLKKHCALIPFWAEHEFSTVLFRRMRSFWRPFFVAAVFVAGAYYLGPSEGTGYVYMLIACIVYEVFLFRLYYRLAKAFGKGFKYTILMVLFPLLFLLILAFGKSEYTPPQFKEEKQYGLLIRSLQKIAYVLITITEIAVFVFAVGLVTISTYPPKPLVNSVLSETYQESKDIVSDDQALSREDTMGAAAASLADMPRSRERFFPDHSGDSSVVVMEYIIGSDLEDKMGMASANIRMMQDAAAKGDALTFVLQTGGSRRWFTSGIADESYGRYTIAGGKTDKVMDLDSGMSMEEPENLSDFISWTAENYPADRYILVLWDHGGGVSNGYGVDSLKHREDDDFSAIRVSEIADAIDKTGIKFDMIGFDACLMQDAEIAVALEPYADYYIASEETEGGLGWFYTDAFGRLAADPGISSEDFGKCLISTYDQFNTVTNDDKPKNDMTLSFVDLTLVKPAYDKLSAMFDKLDKALRADSKDYAEIGLAASSAYSFTSDIQIDLIDFVNKLGDADINDSICSEKEREDVINAFKACVVYRNRNSAEGINGMALAFPYKAIDLYPNNEAELTKLSFKKERKLFNDIFSVIAYQKKVEYEAAKSDKEHRISSFIKTLLYVDYTESDWYVKGFEDYAPDTTLIDIPVTETANGWKIELPEKTWQIIADCKTSVLQKADDGSYRYLGWDYVSDVDEAGHPMVDMDDMWVHINDQLVYYEGKKALETEDGVIFTGDTKARLNKKDDIILHIEWDPAQGEDVTATGHITGYDFIDDESSTMSKGTHVLSTGDSIQFLFDYYDESGKLLRTAPSDSRIIVTKMDDLKVEDRPLEDCDIAFMGVLTDVYQRELLTEIIEAHIGD